MNLFNSYLCILNDNFNCNRHIIWIVYCRRRVAYRGYEGMLTAGRQVVLEKQDDGYWHCIGMGTGGYRLPDRYYEK